jgi:hypothetical protein
MHHASLIRHSAVCVTLALFTVGCVEEGPAEPTPPLPVAGAYTLTLTASSVCRLPVGRFAWDLEATSSGTASATGDTMVVRATLPAGDATVDLSLSAGISSAAAGTLAAESATAASLAEQNLRVTLGGSARGLITSGPAGRGQIVDATYNGPIGLAPPDDEEPDSAGSCTAADHRWSLTPR